jgi:hypothetical protein
VEPDIDMNNIPPDLLVPPHNDIVIKKYGIEDYKSIRKDLSTSFTIQYQKGLLMWPKI